MLAQNTTMARTHRSCFANSNTPEIRVLAFSRPSSLKVMAASHRMAVILEIIRTELVAVEELQCTLHPQIISLFPHRLKESFKPVEEEAQNEIKMVRQEQFTSKMKKVKTKKVASW